MGFQWQKRWKLSQHIFSGKFWLKLPKIYLHVIKRQNIYPCWHLYSRLATGHTCYDAGELTSPDIPRVGAGTPGRSRVTPGVGAGAGSRSPYTHLLSLWPNSRLLWPSTKPVDCELQDGAKAFPSRKNLYCFDSLKISKYFTLKKNIYSLIFCKGNFFLQC